MAPTTMPPGNRDEQLSMALAERQSRQAESLRLFRPLQSQVAAFTSTASELIIRGGNRSGKSVTASVMVASAATARPIFGPDDTALPSRCPTNRPLLIWTIGLGEDHIGDTIHRLLFKSGTFPIIQDKYTGRMRAYRPWDPEDAERADEKKDSPPLIPERLIKSWAWENKAANVFKQVELTNGTIIKAYPSTGDVKMGDPVDLIWIDEDIRYSDYVGEWQARLSDRKGRIIWSAWPHCSNTALMDMSRRAAEQRKERRAKLDVEEVLLAFRDNPFIDADEKRKRLEGWLSKSPQEARSRDGGEFITDTVLMYPNFASWIHCMPAEDGLPEDAVQIELKKKGWQPPADWTRYLVMDPGHSCCAISFWAVPGPDVGDVVVMYDELYLSQCDAKEVARQVKAKVSGHTFQCFIIDNRLGRQTAAGFGKTFRQHYSEAFEAEGIKSIESGYGFIPGSDDVSSGIEAVRGWLTLRKDGRPKLRMVLANTSHAQREFVEYRKKFVRDEAQDKPADGQRDHLMDTIRYAAMHGLPYVPVKPGHVNATVDPTMQAFKDLMQRGQSVEPGTFHMGAGAVS